MRRVNKIQFATVSELLALYQNQIITKAQLRGLLGLVPEDKQESQ